MPGSGARLPGGLMVGEFDDGFGDPYGHLPVEPGAAPFAPTTATCEPSGWLALELDSGTADPRVMSDMTLIESIVGFDRITSWAAARQAAAGRAGPPTACGPGAQPGAGVGG